MANTNDDIRVLCCASKFIDALIKNGYHHTNLQTLLRKMDIPESADDVRAILVVSHNDKNMIETIVERVGYDRILCILDELATDHQIKLFIYNKCYKLDNLTSSQIINYNISSNAYIDAICTYNVGYRIVSPARFDRWFYSTHITNLPQQILNACHNGLHLQQYILNLYYNHSDIINSNYRHEFTTVAMNDTGVTAMKIIDTFTNIKTLYVDDARINIDPRCELTIAKNVEVLVTKHVFNQSWLNAFTNLQKLDVSHNCRVTTCDPFAKTLRILDASGLCCNISDKSLKLCTKIKQLIIDNNINITTCAPFPNIKILHAQCNDRTAARQIYDGKGINDAGLASCTRIHTLRVYNNPNIKTCAPFARTLKILSASGESCGINDAGLTSCTRIKILNISNNTKIISSIPFTESLISLTYSNNYIRNFNMCKNLRKLSSESNDNY